MKKTIPVVDRVDSLIALMVENSSRFVAIPIEVLRLLRYQPLLWVLHNPKLSILKLRI